MLPFNVTVEARRSIFARAYIREREKRSTYRANAEEECTGIIRFRSEIAIPDIEQLSLRNFGL